MPDVQVRDVVTWSAPRGRSAARGAARAVGLGAAALLDLGLSVLSGGTGATSDWFDRPTARWAVSPDDLTRPTIRLRIAGEAPWLPRSWADPATLVASRAYVRLERSGHAELDVDPRTWTLVTLHPERHEGREVVAVDQRCTAEVLVHDGAARLTGQWIALAWLGLLAGWPDPGGGRRDGTPG